MAIGDKPADLPEWATDAGAQITEPTGGKKTLGWIQEKPPFQFFNWFWNKVYLWLAFTKMYAETHVHSGGVGDFDAPKVSLVSHIEWGTNGEVEVITDSAVAHEIQHMHFEPTGTAIIATDQFRARNYRIRTVPGNYQTEFEDESPFVDVRAINFKPVSGLGTGPVGLSSGMYSPSQVQPPGGNATSIFPHDRTQYRKNLLKVTCRARFTSAVSNAAPSNTVEASYNVSGNFVSNGAAEYAINLQSATVIDGVITATIEPAGTNTEEYRTRNTRLVGTQIITEVEWNNAGTWSNVRTNPPTDTDFYINLHAS